LMRFMGYRVYLSSIISFLYYVAINIFILFSSITVIYNI